MRKPVGDLPNHLQEPATCSSQLQGLAPNLFDRRQVFLWRVEVVEEVNVEPGKGLARLGGQTGETHLYALVLALDDQAEERGGFEPAERRDPGEV